MDAYSAVTIDRLTPKDASRLGTFFELLAADEETVRFFHPHALTRAYAVELCACQGRCRDRYFAMSFRGRVVGYSMLRGWDEGYTIPSFGGATHPALRGLGLGQVLLRHAIRESEQAGAPKLRLTVYRANERATHVYRKLGFVFSEKNEREWIGLLSLPAFLAPERPLDVTRLEAWWRSLASAA